MRIYDPRLGRFLSVDPISKQYPELTPYQFASNTPIQAIDRDGLEAWYNHNKISGNFELSSAYGPRNPKVMNANGLYEESQVPKEISQIVKQNKINAKIAQTQRNIQAGQQLQRAEALNSNIFWNIEQLYINPLINVGLDLKDGNYGKAAFGTILLITDFGAAQKEFGLADDFMAGLTKQSRDPNLQNIGLQLQKHAGREGGAFNDIKFSHKTGNEQGMEVLNDIMTSKDIIQKTAERGGKEFFDKSTGRGFAISRNGQFNGFKELNKK